MMKIMIIASLILKVGSVGKLLAPGSGGYSDVNLMLTGETKKMRSSSPPNLSDEECEGP
jgi:hypothetical protein